MIKAFTATLYFISFYNLFSFIISQCLPKSKFPACANFIQYMKKYQKNFWTEQTQIVTFNTTFWTFLRPTNDKFELAQVPTKKTFAIQSVSFLQFKVTAAIYSQRRSQQFQKRNWVSTRKCGWSSQSFWSSQQSIAVSITQTKIWDWIHKSRKRTVQSLLQAPV